MPRVSTYVQRRLGRVHRRSKSLSQQPAYRRRPFIYEFDASLRLTGLGDRHDEIRLRTGIEPTHVHRKGEARSPRSKMKPWQEDVWLLASPLGTQATLDQHVEWLWQAISPHKGYFSELVAASERADLILGCLTESPYPMLTTESASLRILRELEVSVTFNVTFV